MAMADMETIKARVNGLVESGKDATDGTLTLYLLLKILDRLEENKAIVADKRLVLTEYAYTAIICLDCGRMKTAYINTALATHELEQVLVYLRATNYCKCEKAEDSGNG